MTYRPRRPKLMWAVMLASVLATVAARASAQSIIDQWSAVPVPPPPKLEKVTIDPKSTALLVLGFVRDSCNQERRPRCVATIPHLKKLLDGARAHCFGAAQRTDDQSVCRPRAGRPVPAPGRSQGTSRRPPRRLAAAHF
jgi:hypothetical protein